jgi:phosphoribosylamine--glycine ligase
LCVTTLGKSVKEAQEKAYDLVKKVDWQGSYYRTDIGFKAIN